MFQTILGICRPVVSARLQSGADLLVRPLSSGKQEYSTDKTKWPLTEPMPKLSAKLQVRTLGY